MKKLSYSLLLLGVIAALLIPSTSPVSAAGPQWVVVNWGDTLYSISVRYGTSVPALMRANGLPNANFVYAGQRLFVPANGYTPPSSTGSNYGGSGSYYYVRPGDTLYLIAARYGTTLSSLAQANRLWNYDFIYTGQRLFIPGRSTGTTAKPPPVSPPKTSPPPSAPPSGGGKWIDINISRQNITAYQGSTALKTVLVSTGVARHPSPVGRYAIYSKYTAYTMSGGTPGVDYYYLPNVPWTMFFVGGYAIHGTYWHHNFGHPMSHGCINLTIADAKWFFDFAPIGTPVVLHY